MAAKNEPRTLVKTDQATATDGLGYESYRDTLVEVIRRAETPLTVGIFGAWGSGKTSLLLMLQAALDGALDEPRARTVWFNAWQYNQEQALWRALISRVLEALRPPEPEQGSKPDEAAVTLNRQLGDLQAALYRDVDREETGGFEVDWQQLATGGLKGAVKFGLSYIPGVNLLEDLVAAAKQESTGWAEEVLAAFQREKTRIHVDHVKFLERFRETFQEVIAGHVVQKGERLVVFVDDLDRCLPEKAVEVLEAIKLFLDVKGCVFVIAVDRNVVVEGIRVKYRDFALHKEGGEELPITGADYLEKIVQLPFHLPPVRRTDMAEFINKEMPGLPDGCAEVFALGVETNPRKIKRALNVFWMHDQLAERQAERRPELTGLIKPVRLAKVVVIQNRYPDCYEDWVGAPLLLRHLEERLLEEKDRESAEGRGAATPRKGAEELAAAEAVPAEERQAEEARTRQLPPDRGPALVDKWAKNLPLRRMLEYQMGVEEMGFAGMPQTELEAYIYLTSTAAVTEVTQERLDERIWEDLLSNDFTRVESAVGRLRDEEGRIREDERQGYVQRLLGVIAPGTTEQAAARASAGIALASLGDPRDLDELVTVPAGPFRMGSGDEDEMAYGDEKPQHPVELAAFRIGKYPVTNAQFRAFLEAGGYDESGYWTEAGWAWRAEAGVTGPGRYGAPFDLPNHPAAGVSWYEALAYCKWLTGAWRRAGVIGADEVVRLPSEAEWEKAARGPEGRVYPWGKTFDAGKCNMGETGIGATSAVGVFPGGASPYGALDMSGNVWEWTRSLWGQDRNRPEFGYPYDPIDGRENLEAPPDGLRVLRGGAFDDDQLVVRCALRDGDRPDYRLFIIGFRIVVSPISSPSAL